MLLKTNAIHTDWVLFPFRLPGHVLFSEEPLIARWDYKKKYWRQDGFTDMSYDEGRLWSLTALHDIFEPLSHVIKER